VNILNKRKVNVTKLEVLKRELEYARRADSTLPEWKRTVIQREREAEKALYGRARSSEVAPAGAAQRLPKQG
jgi:hypothetical protein